MSARRALLLLLLLAVLVAGGYYWLGRGSVPSGDSEGAVVVSVHDGDTFTLTGGERVRILGIDTPEVPPTASPAQCYGDEAADEVRSLIEGESVRLLRDDSQPDTDQYGRLLRQVIVEGTGDLAGHLVLGGFARVYEEYPVRNTEQYLELQKVAQAAGEGGWSRCSW